MWHYHYVLAFYTRPVLIIWFNIVSSGIIIQLYFFFVGFEPKALCFTRMRLLSSKSCWVTSSLYELKNSLLPKAFLSWKIKLLIFTYLTEVSWRSVNIYIVLGKCKALWATLRLGLNAKAENPPPITVWAILRTWDGTETEFRKTDHFWIKLWHNSLLNNFTVFFQVGEKIWGVTASNNCPVSSTTRQKDVTNMEAGLKNYLRFRKETIQNDVNLIL